MKTLITGLAMLFMLNAHASIEHVSGQEDQPTAAEIAKNRACFEELAKQGCGDPGGNIREFRQCLHESFPSLTDDCQKMMKGLYGKK